MPKKSVSELCIEVTRKCNMSCEHCLRGEQQNLNIKEESINNIFKQINSIGTLTITGGEPSLNVKSIQKIIELAKFNNVEIDNFYLATNAKKVTDKFMKVLLDMHLYCLNSNGGFEEEGIKSLHISNDNYHTEIEKVNMNKLLSFKFAEKKFKDYEMYDGSLISEGRAQENSLCGREKSIYGYEIFDDQIEGMLYLNCNGDLVSNCDLSYESQDIVKFGNVNEQKFNLMKCINKYNSKIESMAGKTAVCDFEYQIENAAVI